MRFILPSAPSATVPSATALALLASCVGAPAQRAPAPAPAPRPAAVAHPALPSPPPADWQDRATTAGDWRYQADGAGSAALFGADVQSSLFIIRCDRATRRISLLRPGPAQAAMTVRTSYGAVNWPASAASGTIPATQAIRAASDATLDQMAYSRGRFAVEVQATETLVLPSWAEVSRVVEDCRT